MWLLDKSTNGIMLAGHYSSPDNLLVLSRELRSFFVEINSTNPMDIIFTSVTKLLSSLTDMEGLESPTNT